jgi:TolB-like protein/DNA-binding winged helix-turn-helix (wHTH) protein/Flp pilus assembly protein TadD
MNVAPRIVYEFGPFRIEPDHERVLRDGQPLAITPKAFEVLLALVSRSHEVVCKDELMQAVWPDRVVEEANLSQCIFLLRKLLGDTRGNRRYIVTLPGQGYRFAGPVRTVAPGEPEQETPQGDPTTTMRRYTRREDPDYVDAVVRPPAESSPPSTTRKPVFVIVGMLMALVLAIGGGLLWHFGASGSQPVAAAATPIVPIPAKSIAVLPFENLSSNKENAYFAAGMQDMILTKLADIGDLKVISRTSTESYGSHPENLKAIAEQLGVATVLEGSVQRFGDKVLVDVQLIDAASDNHIWAKSYTRTLRDLFGVEGEVADSIAKTLNAKLTTAEAARLARVPTTNGAALDAYLRGEYDMAAFNRDEVKSDVANAVREYSQAIKLDPEFALAWAHLAHAQVFLGGMTSVDSAARDGLRADAKDSIARALALQPDLADVYTSQGIYDLFAAGNRRAALLAFKQARTLQPQRAQIWWWIGYTLFGLDNFEGAVHAFQNVQILDPKRPPIELASAEWHLHHFAQAEALYNRALALSQDSWVTLDALAGLYAYRGDLSELGELIETASPTIRSNPNFVDTIGAYLTYRRDWAAARKVYANAEEPQNLHAAYYPVEVLRGDVDWYAGDKAAARTQYERALPLIQSLQRQHPESARWHAELGWVYARLGRNADALKQGRRALGAHDPTSGVVRHTPRGALALSRIEAQIGMPDQAIGVLDQLLALRTGTTISVPLLKLDPAWDPIRDSPRFQALLQKYANDEPGARSAVAAAITPTSPTSASTPAGRP